MHESFVIERIKVLSKFTKPLSGLMKEEFNFYDPKKLQGIVEVIGGFHSDNPSRYKVLPNGKLEILFFLERSSNYSLSFSKPTESEYSRGMNQSCILFGDYTKPTYVSFERIQMMVVIMEPVAAKAVFGLPAYEMKDLAVEPFMIKNLIPYIQDNLQNLPNFIDRAQFLEKFILKKIQEFPELHLMMRLIQSSKIVANGYNGFKSESRLDWDHINFSRAHFHRLCKDWLGITYAQYLGVHQFRRVINQIATTKMPLTDIAYSHGYFDQSHFNRRFKAYSDMSPGAFRKAQLKMVPDTIVL